jgi:hypothetical protein
VPKEPAQGRDMLPLSVASIKLTCVFSSALPFDVEGGPLHGPASVWT